jgi:hypothetical protein
VVRARVVEILGTVVNPRDLPPGSIIRMGNGRLALPMSLVVTWPLRVQQTLERFERDLYAGYILLPAHWEMPIGRIEHVQPPPSPSPDNEDPS